MNKGVKILILVVVGLLLVSIVGAGVVKASDDAIPGDTLYTFDKFGEDMKRIIVLSESSENDLEVEILNERVEELEQLMSEDEVDQELVDDLLSEIDLQVAKVKIEIEFDEDLTPAEVEQIKAQVREELKNQYEKLLQIRERYENEISDEGFRTLERAETKIKIEYEKDGTKIEIEIENDFEDDEYEDDEYEDEDRGRDGRDEDDSRNYQDGSGNYNDDDDGRNDSSGQENESEESEEEDEEETEDDEESEDGL